MGCVMRTMPRIARLRLSNGCNYTRCTLQRAILETNIKSIVFEYMATVAEALSEDSVWADVKEQLVMAFESAIIYFDKKQGVKLHGDSSESHQSEHEAELSEEGVDFEVNENGNQQSVSVSENEQSVEVEFGALRSHQPLTESPEGLEDSAELRAKYPDDTFV